MIMVSIFAKATSWERGPYVPSTMFSQCVRTVANLQCFYQAQWDILKINHTINDCSKPIKQQSIRLPLTISVDIEKEIIRLLECQMTEESIIVNERHQQCLLLGGQIDKVMHRLLCPQEYYILFHESTTRSNHYEAANGSVYLTFPADIFRYKWTNRTYKRQQLPVQWDYSS